MTTVSSKNLAKNYYDTASLKSLKVYGNAWMAFIGLLLTIPIMWGLNAIGHQGYNIAFMTVGALLWLMWTFAPNHVLLAMFGGGVVNKLMDKDGTQGTIAGFKAYVTVVSRVLFYYCGMCLFLIFVSFREHPSLFWFLLPIAVFTTAMAAAFKINTDKRTIMMGNIFAAAALIAALVAMVSSQSDAPTINDVVANTYAKAVGGDGWFSSGTNTPSKQIVLKMSNVAPAVCGGSEYYTIDSASKTLRIKAKRGCDLRFACSLHSPKMEISVNKGNWMPHSCEYPKNINSTTEELAFRVASGETLEMPITFRIDYPKP